MSTDNLMDVKAIWKDSAGVRSLTLTASSLHSPTPDNPAQTHTLYYAFPQLDITDLPKPPDVYLPLLYSRVLALQNEGKYNKVVELLDTWAKE